MRSTASLSAPVPGSIVAGRYEVRDELGQGAQGQVFEAVDRKLARLVALKILPTVGHEDAEALHRFHAEARAAARLRHPAIVTVYDTGESDGFAWMAMELVIGQTLRDALRAAGRPPLPEALRIIRELLDALDAAHARGVAHRDVKPSNILLAIDAEDGLGAVRLADFGIASMAGVGIGRAGDMIGTPAVMAPEQIRGEDIDHRVDLWSAGIVFYELVTGSMPFAGGVPKIYDAILHREPLAPSLLNGDLPSGFDDVIRRALEKDPERRFQSAREMQAAIAALAGGTGDAAADMPPPMVRTTTPREAARRSQGIGLALAFLAGTATGVAGLLAVGPQRIPPLAAPPAAAAGAAQATLEPRADRIGTPSPAVLAHAPVATNPTEAPHNPETDVSATAAASMAEAPREPETDHTADPSPAVLAHAPVASNPIEAPHEAEEDHTEAMASAAADGAASAGLSAEQSTTDTRRAEPPPAPACDGEGPQIATGNHPRFGRFVLRWSQPTTYRALPSAGRLRLEFDTQRCITRPDRIAMPRNIRAVRAGPAFVEIDLVPGREVRHFTLDRRTVVDVYD